MLYLSLRYFCVRIATWKKFFVTCACLFKKRISFATVLTIKTSKIMKTAGKQPKVKEPVRIRSRRLKNGSQSIYLDTYNNGERSFEWLKLYIIPEHSQVDKDRNRETLEQARIIQAQRVVELQGAAHGLPNASTRKQKMLLCEFVKHIADKKRSRAEITRPAPTFTTRRYIVIFLITRPTLQ
jgi:hypothetical protein